MSISFHLDLVVSLNHDRKVIPDYAKMSWIVRAPTTEETVLLAKRVRNCLECVLGCKVVLLLRFGVRAAALATDCRCEIQILTEYENLAQNEVLGETPLSRILCRITTCLSFRA
jgi:metal-dependent amidase/aminoacylase/carboxypeptidase family protein